MDKLFTFRQRWRVNLQIINKLNKELFDILIFFIQILSYSVASLFLWNNFPANVVSSQKTRTPP